MTPAHSPCTRNFPEKPTFEFQHPFNCFAPSTPQSTALPLLPAHIYSLACNNCRAAWCLDRHRHRYTQTSHIRAIPFPRRVAWKTRDSRDQPKQYSTRPTQHSAHCCQFPSAHCIALHIRRSRSQRCSATTGPAIYTSLALHKRRTLSVENSPPADTTVRPSSDPV